MSRAATEGRQVECVCKAELELGSVETKPLLARLHASLSLNLFISLSTGGAGRPVRAENRRPVCGVRAQAHALRIVNTPSFKERLCVLVGECARGWGTASFLTRA